jgi:hypothetical protein
MNFSRITKFLARYIELFLEALTKATAMSDLLWLVVQLPGIDSLCKACRVNQSCKALKRRSPPIGDVTSQFYRWKKLGNHLIARVTMSQSAAIWAVIITNLRLDHDLTCANAAQLIQAQQWVPQVVQSSKAKNEIK